MTTIWLLRLATRRGGAPLLVAALLAGCAGTADTPIAEQAFRMTLPGPWTSRHDPSGTLWVFGSSAHPEQLTVQILRASEPMEPDEQAKTLDEVVDHRRKAQIMRAQSPVLLSETIRSTQGDTLVARYEGIEPVGPKWSATMVLVTRYLAAVFYFEHIGDKDDRTAARVRAAFDSVVLQSTYGTPLGR